MFFLKLGKTNSDCVEGSPAGLGHCGHKEKNNRPAYIHFILKNMGGGDSELSIHFEGKQL